MGQGLRVEQGYVQAEALGSPCEEGRTGEQVSSGTWNSGHIPALAFSPHSTAQSACLHSSLRSSVKMDRVQPPIPISIQQMPQWDLNLCLNNSSWKQAFRSYNN